MNTVGENLNRNMVDNYCGLIPEGLLFGAHKTEVTVKEIQRAIFDQNLATTFETETKGSDIVDGCGANYVRGKNMPYFLLEDKDDEDHSVTEIKNLRTDFVEFGEKGEVYYKAASDESPCQSISGKICQDLKTSETNYPKHTGQDNDEGKLFPYEFSFESINKTVTKNWKLIYCHSPELSSCSPTADLRNFADSKPGTKYESEDHDGMTSTDEQGNENYSKDQGNSSVSDNLLKEKNYDQRNENYEDRRQVKRGVENQQFEEKENCEEMFKKSKIRKASSESEVEATTEVEKMLQPERELTKN